MRARAAAAGLAGAVGGLAAWDLLQTRHSILRNFPVVGHLRFALEAVGPELRQYIVTDNDQERPFSRDQRRWVYTSAKSQDRYFGFGTDNDLESTPSTPPSRCRRRPTIPVTPTPTARCRAPRCSAPRVVGPAPSARRRS